MNAALQIITEKHSAAVRELAEHLDCRDDRKGMQLLEEVLDYDVMLVRFLNDFKRGQNGTQRHEIFCKQ
jgi:hypothetical protein